MSQQVRGSVAEGWLRAPHVSVVAGDGICPQTGSPASTLFGRSPVAAEVCLAPQPDISVCSHALTLSYSATAIPPKNLLGAIPPRIGGQRRMMFQSKPVR